MRLLQIMAGARHGGAEAFFERLAPALLSTSTSERLIIRKNAARAGRLRAEKLEVIEVPFGGFFDFRTRPALREAIEEFAPHIVLSWMNRATKFCPKGNFVHAARLGGYYNLKYYGACDHLIGNTRGIVKYLSDQGWPSERIHYLPNFVTVEKVPPVPRRDLATPPDVPLVLALGRLHRNKGFDVLLAALAKTPNFHLWLAGEGPEETSLRAQTRALGIETRVHFLGWRQDISALLASADMFLCPSRIEPLGNVVIEAWAASVPVVATQSAGPLELMKDGETGMLVPLEDADALAAAMKRLAENEGLRRDIAAKGRAAYEKEFSETRVIALYREFFEMVKR